MHSLYSVLSFRRSLVYIPVSRTPMMKISNAKPSKHGPFGFQGLMRMRGNRRIKAGHGLICGRVRCIPRSFY